MTKGLDYHFFTRLEISNLERHFCVSSERKNGVKKEHIGRYRRSIASGTFIPMPSPTLSGMRLYATNVVEE